MKATGPSNPLPSLPREIVAAMHARRDVRVEPTDFEARRARIAFLRSWHELAAEGHVAARAVVAQPHIREEWAAYQRRVAAFE